MKKMWMAIACCIGISGAVQAQDWKSYSGVGCLPIQETQDIRRSLGGISNWDNTSGTFYCPLVKDIAAANPNGLQRVNVRIFNNHSTAVTRCVLASRNADGVTLSTDSATCPVGIGACSLNLGPLATINGSNAALYCILPERQGARKTIIRSYSMSEI
ncbi:hypothetical protein [Marinibactrum halimedae]|uniref:Uncharacterized protein n=1 Tax=Marinibactrum halimedae TaxID=1444977 RepID=A0AA37WP29_9GAMM|nr:hypothetical protein [Marinibactrum halimedae]MCD9457397.1 hypothetical protein [Marinibactrum halimedae]GLS25552.1 hypothetical protein GCM10007877_12660 [Marinibactrum halimedae]